VWILVWLDANRRDYPVSHSHDYCDAGSNGISFVCLR
jgi:hypothetical protein